MSNNPNQDEDFEWDGSKATVTAYATIRRKTYGRRSSATVQSSSFQSFASSSANNNVQQHQPNRAFGRKKFIRHESLPIIGDCDTQAESSFNSSASATKSPSRRSMSMTSFNEFGRSNNNNNTVDEENVHPNIIDNNFSYQDSLSFSAYSGPCFSSICQSSEHNGFNNIPLCLTPSRSISSSSRKRGVCESPSLFQCDDMSSSGGISVGNMHQSTSSFRRARSRIFSPERPAPTTTSAAVLPTTTTTIATEGMTTIRKKNESFHESESEIEVDMDDNENSFSFHNTSCEMSHIELDDVGKTEMFNIYDNDKDKTKLPLPLPLRPRRMSSVGDTSFEEAIFGQVENNATKKVESSSNQIFDSMSSYEDLKFLLKQLRRWSGGKLLVSFGMIKNCTVVPPNSWPAARKSAFIEWTTISLGFSHRCCGGGVNYLQIPAGKAKKVQDELERALLQYKEASKKNEGKSCVFNKKSKKTQTQHQTPLPMSSIKISRIE